MNLIAYCKDGKRICFEHVTDLTWSKNIIYIDCMQIWNESTAPETHCLEREKIAQIVLKERED